jgi:hypothetical protein
MHVSVNGSFVVAGVSPQHCGVLPVHVSESPQNVLVVDTGEPLSTCCGAPASLTKVGEPLSTPGLPGVEVPVELGAGLPASLGSFVNVDEPGGAMTSSGVAPLHANTAHANTDAAANNFTLKSFFIAANRVARVFTRARLTPKKRFA